MGFIPNVQQASAIDDGEHWWNHRRHDQKIFSITGVAGAGKTSMFEELLARLGITDDTKLVAPTWKAARVLSHRSGRPVTSIHAFMYLPKADALNELRKALSEEVHASEPNEEIIESIQEQMKELQSTKGDLEFVLNPLMYQKTAGIRSLGCDEASMVGDVIGRDMESLEIPLILMYDPFQLPPVKAKFAWEDLRPDVFLTQIMRTGEGSGVAYAAGDIRLGKELQSYGEDFKIIPKGKLSFAEYAENYDMIIVGTNALRRRMNEGIRKYKKLPDYPVEGDQIMSLNNQDNGISNGEVFRIEKINSLSPRICNFDVVDLFGNKFRHVKAWRPVFEDDGNGYMAPFGVGQFTYGYCLTAHKAQGSEAERVCVLDSWSGADYQRWLYTAVTRASKTCHFIR